MPKYVLGILFVGILLSFWLQDTEIELQMFFSFFF